LANDGSISMSSGPTPPQPPSPTESAQAEASAQLAGQMFQAQNAPALAEEDALTRSMIQPYETKLQSAMANQSAYDTDPQAYQSRQMSLGASNQRLGDLYGVSPGAYTPQSQGVQMPSTSMLPDTSRIAQLQKMFAGLLSSVNIDRYGNVTPMSPTGSGTNLNARSF
jgi:hypothetical protein